MNRTAILRIDKRDGVREHSVRVVGEAYNRYRIQVDEIIDAPGRRRLTPGCTYLVPRWSIRFNPPVPSEAAASDGAPSLEKDFSCSSAT